MSRTIDIEALCADKGLRITEQRKVIARVLGDSEDHPDVETLHARASTVDPNISIATALWPVNYHPITPSFNIVICCHHTHVEGATQSVVFARGVALGRWELVVEVCIASRALQAGTGICISSIWRTVFQVN